MYSLGRCVGEMVVEPGRDSHLVDAPNTSLTGTGRPSCFVRTEAEATPKRPAIAGHILEVFTHRSREQTARRCCVLCVTGAPTSLKGMMDDSGHLEGALEKLQSMSQLPCLLSTAFCSGLERYRTSGSRRWRHHPHHTFAREPLRGSAARQGRLS